MSRPIFSFTPYFAAITQRLSRPICAFAALAAATGSLAIHSTFAQDIANHDGSQKALDFHNVQPSSGHVWAVIAGVDYHDRHDVQVLSYSISDASLFRKVLNLDPAHIIYLASDTDRRPTRSAILSALSDIAAKAGPADTFWFYFSGHGIAVNDGSYLAPEDFQYEKPDTFVSVTDVRNILKEKCRAGARIIVLDACHSGSTRSMEPSEWRPNFEQVEGTVTIAACQMNQVAYEFPRLGAGPGSGVFTYYLVKGLYGGASGSDGWVHLGDLKDWVTRKVAEECRRHDLHTEQIPLFLYPESGADIRVSQRNDDLLKQMESSDTPSPAPLTVQKPAGPGIIVSVSATSSDEVAATITSRMNSLLLDDAVIDGQRRYEVLSGESVQPYLELLRNPDDSETRKRAEKLARCLLLRVDLRIDSQAQQDIGTYSARVTATAQLLDRDGHVLAEIVAEPPATAGFSGQSAIDKAAEKAATILYRNLQPKLNKLLM